MKRKKNIRRATGNRIEMYANLLISGRKAVVCVKCLDEECGRLFWCSGKRWVVVPRSIFKRFFPFLIYPSLLYYLLSYLHYPVRTIQKIDFFPVLFLYSGTNEIFLYFFLEVLSNMLFLTDVTKSHLFSYCTSTI